MHNYEILREQTPAPILHVLEQNAPIDMAAVLHATEPFIPELLKEQQRWHSLYIDYEPPHLMRLWTQLGLVRINLHDFLPADVIDAAAHEEESQNINLYHPHPWAAAFRIHDGAYNQWFGYAKVPGIDRPPPRTRYVRQKAGDVYAMNDPLEWHQVIPLPAQAVSTTMVTYRPRDWSQKIAPPATPQRKLIETEKSFMFSHFGGFYPLPTAAPPIPLRAPNPSPQPK